MLSNCRSVITPRSNAVAARFRLVAWLLCGTSLQAACGPVGEKQTENAGFDDADTEANPKVLVLPEFSVFVAEGKRTRLKKPALELSEVWAVLAKLVQPALRMTFEGRTRDGVRSFMFGWSDPGSRRFGDTGIVPSQIVMNAFRPETINPYSKTFAIDNDKFLSALADLKTAVFDHDFTQEAMDDMLRRVGEYPGSMTDADYVRMAKVFYVTVAPAFSDPIKGDIQTGLAGASFVGLAAHSLAKGYARLRRWALLHHPGLAQTTFVVTAGLVKLWLFAIDLDPSLYSILGPFICEP